MVIMWAAYILRWLRHRMMHNAHTHFSIVRSPCTRIFETELKYWSKTYFLPLFSSCSSVDVESLARLLCGNENLLKFDWIGLILRALAVCRHSFKWLAKWQTKIRMNSALIRCEWRKLCQKMNWKSRSTNSHSRAVVVTGSIDFMDINRQNDVTLKPLRFTSFWFRHNFVCGGLFTCCIFRIT